VTADWYDAKLSARRNPQQIYTALIRKLEHKSELLTPYLPN